jgi:Sec-independent protein secretion pathway component TatC
MAKLPGAIQGARIVGERYVRAKRRQNPGGRMPLFDHLRELRNRIVKMALALLAGMTAGFVFFLLNLAGILSHQVFRKWRRVMIFAVFVIAGIANPSPDPVTMLILGGACALLVEVAEFFVWSHDRRRARLHPDPYAGLADDELSPLDLADREM